VNVRTPQNPFGPGVNDGAPVPAFAVTNLWVNGKTFRNTDLPAGQVVLLHVWGAWCSACQHEQPLLMDIVNRYHIPIYSLDYKDNPEKAKTWLSTHGNPYVQTGIDHDGSVSRQLGVYGTPETFLIDKHGIIRYRHVGMIDKKTWEQELFPLITHYRQTD
jgi:cytochrome c biogenesis protein CcmG/thiol:disulfide interchange protein DsbE